MEFFSTLEMTKRKKSIGDSMHDKGCSSKKLGQSAYGMHNMHKKETSWAVDRMCRAIDRLALKFNRDSICFLALDFGLAVERTVSCTLDPAFLSWIQVSIFDADYVSDLVSFN